MFIQILNLIYVGLIGSHYLNLITLPNDIRLILASIFIFVNLYAFFKKRKSIKNDSSNHDDIFVYTNNPKKPSPSDSEMVNFMEDLNKSIKDKEKEKLKIKNE